MENILNEMRAKALKISGKNAKNWTKDAEREIWRMACDNDVFMCEYYTSDDRCVGFYIEDDYYITDEDYIAE